MEKYLKNFTKKVWFEPEKIVPYEWWKPWEPFSYKSYSMIFKKWHRTIVVNIYKNLYKNVPPKFSIEWISSSLVKATWQYHMVPNIPINSEEDIALFINSL